MRSMLLAIAVLGALTIGCVDHRAAPVPTPAAAVEVNTPTAAATLLPTATTPIPLTAESCRAFVSSSEQPSAVVTVSPSAARGGETVRITGSGLAPGAYLASMGIPLSDGVLLRGLPLGSVDTAGVLDAAFTMPSIGKGYCLVLAVYRAVNSGTGGGLAYAHTFITEGNAVSPASCDSLPDPPLLAGAHWARISPPPYRVGSPITVAGDGLRGDVGGGVWAYLDVYYGPPNDGRTTRIDADVAALSADGSYTFTFTPRDDPRLSGLCVATVVAATADGGVGSPYAIARFTYP